MQKVDGGVIAAVAAEPLDPEHVHKVFGRYSEARRLFDDEASSGITFLDEGTHQFPLSNGTLLTVYASLYTPSRSGGKGFQYTLEAGHEFAIEKGVDLAITHGPPTDHRTASWSRGENEGPAARIFSGPSQEAAPGSTASATYIKAGAQSW